MHRNHRCTALARHKAIDTSPRFPAADRRRTVAARDFRARAEPPLDHEVGLGCFHARLADGDTGANAYLTGMLLKVVPLDRRFGPRCHPRPATSAGRSDMS